MISPRAIVHLDADAFFASVEQAADPRLRGKPMAVGGEKRGIIASASYEARKFGIYTPMPTVQARRLCPKLILLPGDFEKYELFSRLMFSYAYDFTPDVEIGSIDEGYFDLTGVRKPAVDIARTIRQAIRQSLKLPVSEGVAANKLVSQVASKLKKPSAFEFVPHGHEAEFLSPLANKWLPGIGPKAAVQLNAAGLARIGQVAQTPIDLLNLLVGSLAPQLHRFAWGIDERPVIPVRASAKSYGEQETFGADTTDEEFLTATLRRMADKLMAKVREDGKSIRTLTVKVRYNDMDEQQASESLREPTDLETEIYSRTSMLLRKAWQRRVSLRLVSLKLSNVYDGIFRFSLALETADRHRDAQERLAGVVDNLREKYGRAVLFRGHDFILRAKNDRGEEPSQASLSPSSQVGQTFLSAGEGDFPVPRLTGALESAPHRQPGKAALPVEAPTHTGPDIHGQRTTSPPEEREEEHARQVAHNLAVVQRQRLGNSFARVIASPGVGLRSRMEMKPPLDRPPPAHARKEGYFKARSANRSPSSTLNTSAFASGFGAIASKRLVAPESDGGGSGDGQPSTTSIPLNLHSYYSFLDSTLSINAIVELAKRHELPALALTDKNNLHGAIEFAQAATEAGIKPIIGAELNWHGHRLCLYVQNQTGYKNLCRILNRQSEFENAKSEIRTRRSQISESGVTAEYAEYAEKPALGFLRVPRVQRISRFKNHKPKGQTLMEGERGSGLDAQPFLNPQLSTFETDGLLALSASAEFAPFFPDRFYLEVNSLEAYEKRPAPLPCVASFPIHYETPADRWKYDIVQSIRTLTLLRQPHPDKRLEGDYHFRPAAEMQRLFAAHPELLANSLEIADRCSFAFSLGKPQFPGYSPPDGSTPADFLHRLVMEGLRRRYPNDHARLKPQLEEELAIILEVGYEEYFLVMWDILQECRRQGIEWITRGSAADSLACYCLEISGVCPIRFELYFRRFLNRDRMALNKLPDIDVDFAHDRKDDVIDLIFKRHGRSNVAVVGGFSTFQSRSAFAEVAKVLGVSEYQVRRLTERLPHFSRASELAETVAGSLECRDLPLDQEPYSTALQMGRFLDGFPRYPKMHPCGLVLSRQPMDEITPCFTSAKGYPTTHFDMDSIEAAGLIKMDILAQGGLAVMRDVMEAVQQSKLEIREPMVELTTKTAENPTRSSRSQSSAELDSAVSQSCTLLMPEAGLGLRDSLAVVRDQRPAEFNSAIQQIENLRYRSLLDARIFVDSNTKSTKINDFPLRSLRPLRSVLNIDSRISDFPTPAGPFNDPQIWDLISSGSARAVHHIESPAMISLCKMCNVRDIDTLIAIVSVIRPGAANEHKKMEFARRYQGLSPVRYPHPSLEQCLRSTYGLVVYEEHILQICEAFAGLPPGRADILRRALAKEKTELVAQIQTEFTACARKLGRTEAEIAEVWELVAGFRGYAFCKAHSTAYGVEAYQSAWLKLHYPAHFMAAVLTNGKGFYSPLVYVLECHRLGIPLLPPSVNEPGPQFETVQKSEIRNPKQIQNKKLSNVRNSDAPLPRPARNERGEGFVASQVHIAIRVPIQQVKGLTQRTKEVLLHERECGPFSSLADFFLRVQPLSEEMEALIRVGAFDSFGQPRTTQYWEFKSLCTKVGQASRLPWGRSKGNPRQTLAEAGEAPAGEAVGQPFQAAGEGRFPAPRPVRALENAPHRQTRMSAPPVETGARTARADAFAGAGETPALRCQPWLLPPGNLDRLPAVPLVEPSRLERLRAEEELLGYPASGHPLELFPDIAWDTYCPVNRLGDHIGEQIITCGLVIEQRLFHQVTGEPMKFITIADWTGVIETELFAKTYQSYGLNTLRYRVLEITATVEPFENGRGHTLRVLRAGKPRTVRSS